MAVTSERSGTASGPAHPGLESRAARDDHLALRLWLRLLASSTEIEDEIRRRLRARFGITLSRFDYLAQLHRHPDGLRMSQLSRCLMVTGGSITGLTDELARDGLVQRDSAAGDRRATLVSLTPQGREAFEAMAAEHEGWVVEMLSGLPAADMKALYGLLGQLRHGVARHIES
ncbi:MAG: MarR family winged helix-turn-helix transcriptional regulator [Aquabacterium sp.]